MLHLPADTIRHGKTLLGTHQILSLLIRHNLVLNADTLVYRDRAGKSAAKQPVCSRAVLFIVLELPIRILPPLKSLTAGSPQQSYTKRICVVVTTTFGLAVSKNILHDFWCLEKTLFNQLPNNGARTRTAAL